LDVRTTTFINFPTIEIRIAKRGEKYFEDRDYPREAEGIVEWPV
jgi:hypothetical protein